MTQTELQKVEQDIENFLLKIEKKMPIDVKLACEKASGYINDVEILLNNNPAITDFSKLIPAAESAREAILIILGNVQKIFNSIDISLQPALINGAGASVSAAVHGVGAKASSYITPFNIVNTNSKQ